MPQWCSGLHCCLIPKGSKGSNPLARWGLSVWNLCVCVGSLWVLYVRLTGRLAVGANSSLSLCVSTATDWCPDSQPVTVGIGSSPNTTLNRISGRRWMEIYKQKHMIAKLSFQLGTKSTNVLISRKWRLQESETDSFICF